ncbi:general substrate transporter [Gigaspora rosea]|uniref:General substrate transporter n=1 Tax=Gigaspora rosea TaxID=44941 RepID=A0A397UPF7_9GLOM|nr:general substrate transporter [Gigaspora rosea]
MERNKSDLLKEEKKNLHQYLDDSDPTLREVEVRTKVTPFLYYIVIVASLSGFAVGYDTAIVGNALLMLGKDYNLTDTSKTMIVGATTLGGTIGSLGAGWLADFSGRKSAIYVAAAFFIIGSLLMALSSTFTVLLISRLISGFGIGIGNMIATLYICEISPKFHRGELVTYNMVLSNAAIIISVLTGLLFESYSGGWRWMSAAASVIPLIQLFALLFIPETPRFLVKKSDFENARKVLSEIYPNSSHEFLDKEIEAIRSVVAEDTKSSYIDLLHYPNLKPSLIVIAIITLPEFCGFDTIMYYSTILLTMAGYNNVNDILKISLIVYGLNFIATVLGLFLVDRVGRRKLLLYTLFAAIIGLFLLGLSFVFITGFTTKQDTCSDYKNNCNGCLGDGRCVFSKQNGGICVLKDNFNLFDAYDTCPNNHTSVFIICSLTFSLMTYALGLGNVPWLLQSELLPLNIRGRGVGVSTASNWVFTFVFAISFLPLVGVITVSGTLWMYAIFTLLTWWFVFLFIPETAGKSLEEIEKLLK